MIGMRRSIPAFTRSSRSLGASWTGLPRNGSPVDPPAPQLRARQARLGRTPQREADAVVGLGVPDQLEGHANKDVVDVAFDDVAGHSGAFGEFHDGDDVGLVAVEGGV